MTEQANGDRDSFPPVDMAESGQKLLQFLTRRLGLPESLLQRWVRTGQIRLNGRRCKPFARLARGDVVRLPPFARKLCAREAETGDPATTVWSELPLVGQCGDVWALAKPAGLAVQPGTGHPDNVVARLNGLFANLLFKPAPAHRLDRDTSGILLLGSTFEALRQTQEDLRQGRIAKEYLVWTRGQWSWPKEIALRHYLRKEGSPGNERIRASAEPLPHARESVLLAKPLLVRQNRSLLQIRLLTGRTHQIRAQLAITGFPVIGDGKYGPEHGKLLLHAFRVILANGHEFCWAPPWPEEFMPVELPQPFSKEFTSMPPLTPPPVEG